MPITIGAAVQTGNRVAVTVAGLSTAIPAVTSATLYRDDLDQPRSPVRGFVDHVPTSDGFVAYDHEAPLARPVWYVLELTRSDGSTTEHVTGASVVIAADYPVVSDPVTGDYTPVSAIVTWTAVERSSRASVVEVVDREDPVVVSGPMTSGTSDPVLRTDSLVLRRALRELVNAGQVVQIRDPHPDVEDTYASVQKHTEQRLTNDPTDVRRIHALAIAHVGAPALGVPAEGTTLQDLADAYPGTLADVNTAYASLLALAAADLEAV